MALAELVVLILVDTFLVYWLEIAAAVIVAAVGLRMGDLCVVILAHAGLTTWVLYSEAAAQVPDRDFVFIMGALLRLLIANGLVAVGTQLLRMFGLREKNTARM